VESDEQQSQPNFVKGRSDIFQALIFNQSQQLFQIFDVSGRVMQIEAIE
jgi:hypothetical protein